MDSGRLRRVDAIKRQRAAPPKKKSVDEEGTELPDMKTAQEEAARSVAALARNVIQAKAANALCHAVAIEVRDDSGAVLQAKLTFEMQLLKRLSRLS